MRIAITASFAAATAAALVALATSAAAQVSPAREPAKEAARSVERVVGPASSLPKGQVQPQAVEALGNMSRFLKSLHSAEFLAAGSLDVVNIEGQRIQVDGTTAIKMKRRGFVIHHVNDLNGRDFYYDGKQFTMVTPKLGFYATVPAPAKNHEVLDTVYSKYGIRLPLEDFFRWADEGKAPTAQFLSAFSMGQSIQHGVSTTHYVFREPELDWEIWIQDGPQPLPLKLAIVDRTNPARPTFTADLSWKIDAPIADSDFTFKPGPDAKRIEMAEYKEQRQ